jgi:hypothetical protein
VSALLQEIKINYVDRLSQQDVDRLRQQNQQIYEVAQGRPRRIKSDRS